VCQTVFTVASETIAREVRNRTLRVSTGHLTRQQARGNLPTIDPEQGELRTLTQLVLDAAEVAENSVISPYF